jgi:hypothetical protein
LVPFKEEIFPVLRRVKVSLSWRGNFFLVMGSYISLKVLSMKFPGISLSADRKNAVLCF